LIDTWIVLADFLGRMGEVEFDRPWQVGCPGVGRVEVGVA
jgi:hypothetical protein